jgi:hypothetical protein
MHDHGASGLADRALCRTRAAADLLAEYVATLDAEIDGFLREK